MKTQFISLLLFLFLFSCEDDEILKDDPFSNYPSEIRFDNSEWLFETKSISCIDFDADGNAWIGSGADLIFFDGIDSLIFDAQSTVLDLAVAPNGTVWLGTKDKGLARFSNGHFTWFSTENSIITRNYIHSLGVDSNNKVWFCSAQHDSGGLMSYDGNRFKLFTPDNSILNQHVIQNLRIDKNNNIYFFTAGKVGNTAVFKINNNGKWEQLGGKDAMFYWLSSLGAASGEKVYVTTDHSLSSSFYSYTNGIGYYEREKWNTLETPFDLNYLIPKLFLDKRDYVWVMHSGHGEYTSFYVFDGSEWHRSAEGQIPEFYYNYVKTDINNNIWFCTNRGIFILKQE